MTSFEYITAEEAVKAIRSGHRVFIHGSAATPVHLIKALQARHDELKDARDIDALVWRGDPLPYLKEGAGVVTTRGHVHWVVTEYGSVNLFGKSLRQRARALIDLAHPDHREELDRAFHKRYKSSNLH